MATRNRDGTELKDNWTLRWEKKKQTGGRMLEEEILY